jgi:polyribonucleotide nucleotidyltransferase
MSGIPFSGPAASVMIGVDENSQLVINPTADKQEGLKGLFAISGNETKILNIEGEGKEITEEVMDEILDMALVRIKELCAAQKVFVTGIAKPAIQYVGSHVDEERVEKIMSNYGSEMEESYYIADKAARDERTSALMNRIVLELAGEGSEVLPAKVREAFDYAAKKMMRKNIMGNSRRFSGRNLDEIRALSAEVDVLPTVHGSALFSRGMTQSLSVVTLGSTRMVQHLDGMEGEETKRFMHHYNMPAFTTGEAGRYNYKPGRREIGHGTIGENALKNMIPREDEFPYTIRVVAEIMTSNGSTSMAATCASSLALMAAGVPLKSPVAGIGVGLITADESQSEYKLLLDIEGVEDFFGDMDFKVTGTSEGITAIQFETKLKGVEPKILKEAFRLSKSGRLQVLNVMNSVLGESRQELAPTAPRVEVVQISTDKIGELIGPGGKNIKAIIEEGNALGHGELEIDINDDGRVTITAVDQAQRTSQ